MRDGDPKMVCESSLRGASEIILPAVSPRLHKSATRRKCDVSAPSRRVQRPLGNAKYMYKTDVNLTRAKSKTKKKVI